MSLAQRLPLLKLGRWLPGNDAGCPNPHAHAADLTVSDDEVAELTRPPKRQRLTGFPAFQRRQGRSPVAAGAQQRQQSSDDEVVIVEEDDRRPSAAALGADVALGEDEELAIVGGAIGNVRRARARRAGGRAGGVVLPLATWAACWCQRLTRLLPHLATGVERDAATHTRSVRRAPLPEAAGDQQPGALRQGVGTAAGRADMMARTCTACLGSFACAGGCARPGATGGCAWLRPHSQW